MGNTYFGAYEVSVRQVTAGAKNQYSHSAAVTGGGLPPPPPTPPVWTGPPTPDTIQQGGFFSTSQYASTSPGPISISISPISTVTQAALAAGGITYNQGLFTAASNATLTSYPNIIELATDLTTGLSANSFPFTLTVTPLSAISWLPSFQSTLRYTPGIPATFNIGVTASGESLLAINKNLSLETQAPGWAFNAASGVLSYDGSIPPSGVAAIFNVQYAASDGEIAQFEEKIPYPSMIPTSSNVSGIAGIVRYGSYGPGDSPYGYDTNHAGINQAGPIAFSAANQNGDWWDANLVAQGSAIWRTVTWLSGVNKATANVTNIVQAWVAGTIPNLGFMLQPAASNTSTACWRSTHDAGVSGPHLTLTFFDNTVVVLVPDADNMIFVGANVQTTDFMFMYQVPIIYFKSLGSKAVTSAILDFTISTPGSGPGSSNIYPVRWNGQDAATDPTYGIAHQFANDAGLASHPAVVWQETFPNLLGGFPLKTDLQTRNPWICTLHTWPNSSNVYDYSAFPNTTFFPGQPPWHPNEVIGDTDPHVANYAPLRPGIHSMRATIFQGEDGGTRMFGPIYPLLGTGALASIPQGSGYPQELWCRFYLRLGDDWNPQVQGGHQTGFRADSYPTDYSTTTNFPGQNLPFNGKPIEDPNVTNYPYSYWQFVTNYAALTEPSTNPYETTGMRTIMTYQYRWKNGISGVPYNSLNRSDLLSVSRTVNCPRSGILVPPELGSRGCLRKNIWYCIELHVIMNSLRNSADLSGFIGNTDGVAEMFVNGRLAYQDLNHVFGNDPNFGVTYFDMEHFLGGTDYSRGGNFTSYWALAAVATQRIGPANLV